MKRAVVLLALAALPAIAASLSPDTPLVTDGPVTVDVRDLDAFLLKAPADLRGQIRQSYDRVASMVDSVFISRVSANKAREVGLDKDPTVQRRLQQLQDQFLAELYLDHVEKEAAPGNLEKRARELYDAQPEQFMTEPQVHVQQVLVSLWGRTREMALERARAAYREAQEGKKDFLEISALYSDDPAHNPNGGDLRSLNPKAMMPPIAEAIAKLQKKGELTEPIETNYGFHVLRFVSRTPAKRIPFEQVKEKIIEAEKQRLQKERVDEFVAKIRNSPSVTIHRDNVSAYVIPVDQKKIEEAVKGK